MDYLPELGLNRIRISIEGIVHSTDDLNSQVSSMVYGTVQSPKSKTDQRSIASLDDILGQIEAGINRIDIALTAITSNLRRHRNTFVNINTLPDEVLLPILNHARATPHAKETMSLKHTCMRWWKLCSSSTEFVLPATSQDVDGASTSYTESIASATIEKVGNASLVPTERPVNLTVDCVYDPEDHEELLADYAPRVRNLFVLNIHAARDDEALEWLENPWPELRSLYLDYGLSSARDDCLMSPLNDEACRVLTFVNCRYPYNVPNYSDTQRLIIEYDNFPMLRKSDHEHNDDTLWSVLAASPALEELTLRNPPISAHEAISLPIPSHGNATELFALRYLRLDMYIQTLGAVFFNMRTSPEVLSTIDISIKNMRYWAGRELNKDFLRHSVAPFTMAPYDTLPALARLRSLSLDYGRSIRGDGLPGSGPHAGRIVSRERWHSPTSLRVRITFGTKTQDDDMDLAFESFLEYMLAHSYIHNLRKLRLCGFRSRNLVVRLLRAAPRLQTLMLDGSCASGVLAFIAERRQHSYLPLVPELDTVSLVDCELSDAFVDQLGPLLSVLRLKELTIQNHVGDSELLQRLQAMGLNAHWKGSLEDALL